MRGKEGIWNEEKSLVMTVAALAAFTSIASAAPATSWEQANGKLIWGHPIPKQNLMDWKAIRNGTLMVVLATPFLINGPCVMIIMG